MTWLRRLFRRPLEDSVWKPTGYRYTFTGHDEAAAVDSAKRANERHAKLFKAHAVQAKPKPESNVVPMRRKA